MTALVCPSLKNPKKVSVVLRQDLVEALADLAEYEGRSMSNLCAHLLEKAIKQENRPEGRHSRT